MSDTNPTRSREARDALRARLGADVSSEEIVALLDIADEGERSAAKCPDCSGSGGREATGAPDDDGDVCGSCGGSGSARDAATAWRLRWASASEACDEARVLAGVLAALVEKRHPRGCVSAGCREEGCTVDCHAMGAALRAVPKEWWP